MSERLHARIQHDFPESADAVLARLDALKLPNAEKPSLERIQAAVVLLTRGDLERLEESAQIAERDWRDALVWSGLGHGDWPERLEDELGEAAR